MNVCTVKRFYEDSEWMTMSTWTFPCSQNVIDDCYNDENNHCTCAGGAKGGRWVVEGQLRRRHACQHVAQGLQVHREGHPRPS